MTNDNYDTAAKASIGEVSGCADRADAQVRAVLGRVLAQRRSAGTALAYVAGLAPGVKANCWALAEAAGYESPYRMQALLGSYRWDWRELRAELPALAQAWADFDVFMPRRWETDLARRRAAGIPAGLGRRTKPQLAEDQLERLLKAGLPIRWAAFDEVYGRSGALRGACQAAGLAYVAVIPRDFRITLPSGAVITAEDAAGDAVFERRSCGNGSKGPRYADWALAATASPRHLLLIRRLLSRPDNLAFYLCWAPDDQPATMTFFVTIAGRRWPCEETFKTGKDTLGWDQSQVRTWDAICRHTALAALAQLRHAAIRNALCGDITLPPPPAAEKEKEKEKEKVRCADLGIPLGDAPVPARPGLPCPPGIGAIKLTIAETARLTRLARQHAAGLITSARLAFHLRWSRWRRRHQARARWHHYATRLTAAST